eukprot:CAMPEP_0168481500 /NCGR_PEP_ID=MMETSP0228-20121227/64544_1 /TAXON_ID=133427 /ORGANISM="Protoceratium reticulatum, Strain CCCM 535 (=CCMP 1889)" /LENGTH=87 /DNA_ID=CAMNT_0008497871 /DNA_START=287 /DNA_END=547 /DNA_ORIENTATION=-
MRATSLRPSVAFVLAARGPAAGPRRSRAPWVRATIRASRATAPRASDSRGRPAQPCAKAGPATSLSTSMSSALSEAPRMGVNTSRVV